MVESKPKQRKRRAGRPLKPEAEKFVLLGGKVPPEMLAAIEEIAGERNWTRSAAVRAACALLIKHETARKNLLVNENLLTG
jgi:hypothetical protein